MLKGNEPGPAGIGVFVRLSFLRIAAAVFTVTVVMPGSASALLVQSDLVAGSGDGLITLDSDSGLEWLDVTETLGQSFIEVEAGLTDSSKVQFGFSYANGLQLTELFTNAGIVDFINPVTGNLVAASNLINLLGCTSVCTSTASLQQGIYDGDPSSNNYIVGKVAIFPGNGLGEVDLFDFQALRTLSFPEVGSYLFRQAPLSSVPLPTALPLFGTGLALMGFIGWRRKRQVAAAA